MANTETLSMVAGRLAEAHSARYEGLPYNAPNLLFVQGAILLAGEPERYGELSCSEVGDDIFEFVLLLVTADRLIRVTARRDVTKAADIPDSVVGNPRAETWGLSRLCRLRLAGEAAAWQGVQDTVGLPSDCYWVLLFDGLDEEVRLPMSTDAARGRRRAVAELMDEIVVRLR